MTGLPAPEASEPGRDDMEGSYPRNLRIWDGALGAVVRDGNGLHNGTMPASSPAAPTPAEVAQQLYACEALDAAPAAAYGDATPEPYTLQWFLNIENLRHRRQGRWIPRLLEFAKHSGETLLGLGHGLGTDWLQYARHGAAVVVCSPSTPQLALIRRNFELRSLPGRFLHALPSCLPLPSASIDVACLTGILEAVAEPQAVIDEVYRVLKPGGKVLAVTPSKYDVDFWYRLCFFWKRWLGSRRWAKQPPKVSFSGRRLRRLFGRFIERRIHKRQLRRSEVPHLWRLLPLPLLERLLGHALIIKAFKPLSTALPAQAAA
jgi:ubiquinone/menaquinone biosynthesis C-methylase UbiE